MTILYGIPNCDTIKKTKKWLESNKVNFEFHDYKKKGCEEKLLKSFLEHFKLDEILNTRGTTWRKLSEHEKAGLTQSQTIKLMCEQPSMIKRPIINHENNWIVGFSEEKLNSLFIK